MSLAVIDWVIIAAFLVISLAIGLHFRNRASTSLSQFFLGGRNLPWYIAGISMVATTFGADTPLAVSELVSQKGIAANWIWWCFLSGGLLTTFFFANLWRRANVLTELEFIELRYSGPEAKFLRGFKAIYLGVFMNVVIIGWVNLALGALLKEFFGIPDDDLLLFYFAGMAIAAIYSSVSGLLGVAFTDVIQFVIAMVGTIILAVIVMNAEEVGGVAGLKANLPDHYFDFFPSITAGGEASGSSNLNIYTLSIGAFFSYVAVQWWASWYPGAEPGGGGYIAQRMMSTKNERHAVLSTLLFQIAHYCLRPWPWILVGLAAVYLYSPQFALEDQTIYEQVKELKLEGIAFSELHEVAPDLYQKMAKSPEVYRSVQYSFQERLGYVYTMKDFLPDGLRGLLLVAFLAAYLSTISTQLNWGASYLINDFYLPFIDTGKDPDDPQTQKRYVNFSRIATLVLMLIALVATILTPSISGGWSFLLNCGAGLGLVLILRWYWWRMNAWSEITATVAPFFAYPFGTFILEPLLPDWFADNSGTFLFTVLFTTIAWIIITLLTPATDKQHLMDFYQRVRPDGVWATVRQWLPDPPKSNNTNLLYLFISWVGAVTLVYSVLFTSGKIILAEWPAAAVWAGVAIVGGILLKVGLSNTRILDD